MTDLAASADCPPAPPGPLGAATAWALTVAGLVTVALTALLDYETGPALSLSVLYLIPVALCAWWGGFTHGMLLALAASFAWGVVENWENPEFPVAVGLWNGIARFATLVITASLVARLHAGVVRERRLARTDPLTGAANGRTFYEAVAAEGERAARTGRPLTLAYLDLDNFKQLNDRDGHAAGDAALLDLVRTIAPNLRTVDVVARLGGDEFALLLPETDADGAVALLTRLQGLVGQRMASTGRGVTVSIGAVTFRKPLWDIDLMVQQVDALMYTAKRRGKDRVEHAVVHSADDLRPGDRLRLERRATARSVCAHAARVRPDGAPTAGEVLATIHDLSPDGIGLRTDRRFADGSVLIVEPLAGGAKTLLARVVRTTTDGGGWLHGCELSTPLEEAELEHWLAARTGGGRL